MIDGDSAMALIWAKSFCGSKGKRGYKPAAMTNELSVNNRVWPSGADLATASAPMVPPAPPLFSTTTCWPSCSDNSAAKARADKSVNEPGAKGTTMRKGLVGQLDWAWAHGISPQASADKVNLKKWRLKFIKHPCTSKKSAGRASCQKQMGPILAQGRTRVGVQPRRKPIVNRQRLHHHGRQHITLPLVFPWEKAIFAHAILSRWRE